MDVEIKSQDSVTCQMSGLTVYTCALGKLGNKYIIIDILSLGLSRAQVVEYLSKTCRAYRRLLWELLHVVLKMTTPREIYTFNFLKHL